MIDKERIQSAVREILLAIGENPDREGLIATPDRVARMYEEIFQGIGKNPLDDIKVFNESSNEDIVIVKNIQFYSMCEHHLLPFYGNVSVAYIPNEGNILGLSKIARIIDVISQKPQLQERLTKEIAASLMNAIDPKGVAVIVEAQHLCMSMRGIKKDDAKTVTLALRGIFDEDAAKRVDVINLIKNS